MGALSFSGIESGRGVTLTPHPLLVPRSKNRAELYLYSPQGPSWPVKRVKPTYCTPQIFFVLYHQVITVQMFACMDAPLKIYALLVAV
jgi:hypothetical protein